VDTSESVRSLTETEGVEPWDFCEHLRERGDIVWDDELSGWLVSSYELVREVGLRDDVDFERVTIPASGRMHLGMTEQEWEWFMGAGSTRASLFMISGPEHAAQHRWWMRALSPRVIEQWRMSLLEPICHEEIDRFAGAGRAELVDDYARRVAARVMAGMLGLPTDDQDWLVALSQSFEARSALMTRHSIDETPDDGLVERALAATQQLYDEMRPFVEERRDGTGDDFISMVWRDARTLFGDDFGEADVFAAVITAWQGGTGSVTRGAGNTLYVLLAHPELRDRLQEDTRSNCAAFVEEALRLYGDRIASSRFARADTTLGGRDIRRGDLVLALNSFADRDERSFRSPDVVDLDRANIRSHLGFFTGARTCPGQGLARVELSAAIAALLERLPDVRLDPDAEPPRFAGLIGRAWAPLNVVFLPPR
jgi:cytochrome P450